jgi:hypothetical protein
LSKNKCKEQTHFYTFTETEKNNAIDWENHLYIYGTDYQNNGTTKQQIRSKKTSSRWSTPWQSSLGNSIYDWLEPLDDVLARKYSYC